MNTTMFYVELFFPAFRTVTVPIVAASETQAAYSALAANPGAAEATAGNARATALSQAMEVSRPLTEYELTARGALAVLGAIP